jgi:amino acid transporter
MITEAPATTSPPRNESGLRRELSLLDATLLVVGGVIGGAIFLTPSSVATEIHSPAATLLLWAFGAVVALAGGLAVAELGTMFPQAGGQYVYLREAYGELPAFLFGWLMFVAGNGGGMATIAVSFALYLGRALPALRASIPITTLGRWTFTRGDAVAIFAIALLMVINVLGVRRTAILQNIATWIKFAAMAFFVVAGLTVGKGDWSHFHTAAATASAAAPAAGSHSAFAGFGVALIAIFWAYDGWIYASWAGGEIKSPERNIPRSLLLGISAIAAIYLAMNVAYLYALPLPEIARSETVASAAGQAMFSSGVGTWLSLLIAVSCFGALSPNVLCSARLLYAMAEDRLFFAKMGEVHPRYHTPAFAIVAQCACAALFTLSGKYDQLFTYTVFAMTLGYMLTVLAVFVLRRKRPDAERPYRCWGYPWTPILYIAVTAAWTANAIFTEPRESLFGLALLALGVPLFLFWKRRKQS